MHQRKRRRPEVDQSHARKLLEPVADFLGDNKSKVVGIVEKQLGG